MDPFSDWAREWDISWFPWTDVDFVGYQHGGESIYILLELKCLPDDQFEPFEPTSPPQEKQLQTYLTLSDAVDAPAFVVWYTEDCHEFKIDPVVSDGGAAKYDKSNRVHIEGESEFLDFLDCYRPEAANSADETFTNRILTEWAGGESD
jgi:hypothetical protein